MSEIRGSDIRKGMAASRIHIKPAPLVACLETTLLEPHAR